MDGNGTQVFTREGCQTNHTSHKFHEIAFEESQSITIQVALNNYQSFVRVSYCVLKNGLDAGKDENPQSETLQIILNTKIFPKATRKNAFNGRQIYRLTFLISR